MTENTTSVAGLEEQAVSAPETTPETGAPPAPESGQGQEEQATPNGGPDPDAILRQFDRMLADAANATLELGKLASAYLSARLLASEACKRDAAVAVLVSRWQEHSDTVVSPARIQHLVRQWHAWCLFRTGKQTACKGKNGVPLRVIREFAPLVERDEDSRAESWHVVPGVAEKARALWTEVTSKHLTGAEAGAAVASLLADHKRAEAEHAVQRAEQEGTPEAKRAADKAEAEAKHAEAKQGQAEAKVESNAKGKGKSNPADPAKVQAPKPEQAHQGEPLLSQLSRVGNAGTVRDFAGLLADAVRKHSDPLAVVNDLAGALLAGDNPDDMLDALLSGAQTADLSAKGKRAIHAARVVLARKTAPANNGRKVA
jgi:hypothetical protein